MKEFCKDDERFSYFTVDGVLSYVGFCDDFGPMSLGTLFEFCCIVDNQRKLTSKAKPPLLSRNIFDS